MPSKLKVCRIRFRKEAFVAQALVPALANAIKAGARAFILAEASRIPVWSGMAIASLAAAAAEVGGGTAININVSGTIEDGTFIGTRIAEGLSMGTSSVVVTKNGAKFTWATSVPHFIENETSTGPKSLKAPTPWNSVPPSEEEGASVARSELRGFDLGGALRAYLEIKK
jgi:hypothetical protein